MTILVDPSHGGSDIGASNAQTGLTEKYVNYQVADMLTGLLRSAGYDVILTRHGVEETVPLLQRQEQIRSTSPDLVISIHHNASPNADQAGAEILAQVADQGGGPSDTLAALLEKEYAGLRQEIRPRIFRYNSAGTGDYYAILRAAAQAGIPAVISEYAFIDNPDDVQRLDTQLELYQEAEAIFRAVQSYFGQNPTA